MPQAILWPQLRSLAILYATVIIGWIAYFNYQPQLLQVFGLEDLSIVLVLAQGIILVLTPPVAGLLGDHYRKKSGRRLPIISAGISFAAMIFMAVAFSLFLGPSPILKMALPFLVILWLISMSIFTSPAISTIDLFAPESKLPNAMAVLVIISDMLYALEVVIVDIINFIGPMWTFVAGGVLVSVAGYGLRKTTISAFKIEPRVKDERETKVVLIIGLGILLGIPLTLAINVFPQKLNDASILLNFSVSGQVLTSIFLMISAVSAYPLSKWVQKYGLQKGLIISGVASIVLSIFALVTSGAILMMCCAILAIALGMLSVSALPLAFHHANAANRVFAAGLFYCGVEIPNSLLETLLFI